MSSIRNKGSLYAHQCPTCGAQLTDSMDITCAYCQTALNSPAHEWIITTIMSLQEYHSFCKNQSHDEKKVSTKPLNLDELYNIKDYAFNNMIVVIGADGVFSDKEKAFAAQMAKKFGYKPQKIEELFLMARAGRLSIRMPEDKNARSKIFHLMERTASVDDNVTAGEKRLVAYMRKKYLTEAV
jgi:hypothetical protein